MSFALPCLQFIVFICSFPRYIFSCPSLFLQLVPWRSSDRHVSKATRQTHWCFPFTFGCHRYCIAYITYSKISSKYLERYTYLHAHILSWYEPTHLPLTKGLLYAIIITPYLESPCLLEGTRKDDKPEELLEFLRQAPCITLGSCEADVKNPSDGYSCKAKVKTVEDFFHVRNLVIGAIVFWWFWCSLSGFDRILWNL